LVTDPYPIQRFTSPIAEELLGTHLFGQCWGITIVKIRNIYPERWLCVLSDPVLDYLVYILGVDSLGYRYTWFIKGFDDWQNPQYFDKPMGVACDSTIFNNNSLNYFIYIADCDHNRLVRAYYNANDEKIHFYDYMLDGVLLNPEDVACLSKPFGGSYIVVADTKHHRILLIQVASNLSYSILKAYGSEGSSIGQFKNPTSVAMVPCRDSLNYYRIYVVDQNNFRIVSLLYNTFTNLIVWEREYSDNNRRATLLSVTSNPYYCVYVTDVMNHNVWVFTPGLEELLYTYGTFGYGDNQFIEPCDIYIYQDEIAITEHWGNKTGIQYFKIIPEIREFYPEPQNFDATEDSVKINFRVDETAHYLTMEVAGRNLFENQYYTPGRYSVWWDGRGADGKVVLPGNYVIRIYCQGQVIATTNVTVKGTLKSGTLAVNEHWTEEGEPYVLTGDVQLPNAPNESLVIEPGVKVMPTGNYGIYPPVYHSGGSTLLARGNSINKILFTPHRKLYPIPDSVPKGFWKGITRWWGKGDRSFERLVLDHCVIEAAGSDSGAVWASPRTKYVSITNTKISKSGGYGLYCDYFRCDTVLVNNCQFIDNDSIPIITPFDFIGEIYDNNFVNNNPNVIAIVGGTRKTDATIFNQGVPYWFLKGFYWECKMEGTSTYCPTLVIQPGVKILFSDSCGLYALSRSKIIAIGKSDSMITFTALDTTRHWRGVHLNNSHPADTSRFEYCEISYGGRFLIYPLDAGVGNLALFDNKGCFVLKNSKIARSMSYGVGDAHLFETDTLISLVQDNIFYANDSFPLIISTTELGECKGNQFIDNKRQGILIRGGGDITKPITMRNQGVPYVIDCWFIVNNRLEIEKGSVLQFRHWWTWFKPDGILKAEKAIFTSYDSLLWSGIMFDNCRTDTSILDSCIIEKAKAVGGSWPSGAVHISNSWVRMINTAIVNNECGIFINGAQSKLTLTNNLISQNGIGISAHADIKADSLYTKFNEFLGNRCGYKVSGYLYPYLEADSNWWGDETGPWDPSSGPPDFNPQGRGDSIGDYVIYRPWLTSPVQPQVVTLLQPNGGETLYCGQEYEIIWRLGDKEMGRQEDGEIKGIRLSGNQSIRNKFEIRNTKQVPIRKLQMATGLKSLLQRR